MWTIFKVFIEFFFYNITSFMFWFFGHGARRILASWQGIKPAPPALEGRILTTGLSEKSAHNVLYPSLKYTE